MLFIFKGFTNSSSSLKDHFIVAYVCFNPGRGHWAVYYPSPQSFKICFLIRWHNIIGELILLNFYWLIHLVECPNVSTANCDLQKG